EAPANLESRVWDSIQAKQNGRRRILLSAISVAASILIAVLLFVYSSRPIAGEMSYQEKEAGLKEALALTDNTENLQYGIEIIYEDESIVIYTK
ncbi:MAG: hypothetical protein JW729_08020, partial [Bacteroidales bacterium]|nr:hypothetical protein [Bacteroidales bacterium]